MRKSVLCAVVVAFYCVGLIGCGKNSVQLDTNSTLRYDSARDGTPKIMGGSGGSGLKKGGAGQTAPPP